ncbi:complement component C9 [Heptranchias perlo]|uniref:complement component C9 n=1 Tax=Heptranchias perlo TaxID=212740 RepID=UPI00355A1CC6
MTRTSAIVSLYVLLFSSMLVADSEGKERSQSENKGHRSRTEREVSQPGEISCELSPWGQWTACQPCKGIKYRSRHIIRFGQFGGRSCIDTLSNEESCPISGNCEEPPVNCGNNFQCDDGQCISRRLTCNDDNDCGDFSDEDDCESFRPPCRRQLEPLEIGQMAGSGMNIFGMGPRRTPFNNKFYNGQCESVFDGNRRTYFRIPWNIISFYYQTRAEQAFTTEVYENSAEVITKIVQESTSNFNLGFSLKLSSEILNVTGGIGITSERTRNLETLMSHFQSETNEYFRVKGQVQLAKFHMRRNRYVLDKEFIIDLKNLPTEYDKGVYFKILEDYGTHYSSSGTLGGDYQLVYVLDKSKMAKVGVTTEHVKQCLGFGANFSIQFNMEQGKTNSPFQLTSNTNLDECKKITKGSTDQTKEDSLIKDVVSFVTGGDVRFLTKLQVLLSTKKELLDASVYTDWASSLLHSAVLVRQQLVPISDLVPTSGRNSPVIRRNLDRAISDYEAEYSVCKCAPCANGGTVIQLDGQCRCLCGSTFQGTACETPKPIHSGRAGYTDGQWSCWSDWSSCTNHQQVRTRQCAGTKGGGAECQGEGESVSDC